MKLPRGEHALVEDEKLMGYVLSKNHPVGRHHAMLFEKLLGITDGNADLLRQALLGAAKECDVIRASETPYGEKFQMRFELEGPRGRRMVRAVWMRERGVDCPRLVTCFVE